MRSGSIVAPHVFALALVAVGFLIVDRAGLNAEEAALHRETRVY